jgi:hypothetical protein
MVLEQKLLRETSIIDAIKVKGRMGLEGEGRRGQAFARLALCFFFLPCTFFLELKEKNLNHDPWFPPSLSVHHGWMNQTDGKLASCGCSSSSSVMYDY